MKIQIFPDLHGYKDWEKHIDKDYFPIFLGDYVDSYVASDRDIIETLESIIAYPRGIKLLGNHDVQYFLLGGAISFRCSGYRDSIAYTLHRMFLEAQEKNTFQYAYELKATVGKEEHKYLFTHAGVTNAWWNDVHYLRKWLFKDRISVADFINKAPENGAILDKVIGISPARGGSSMYAGPLWLDKTELELDPLINYHQVVGHSKVHEIDSISINNRTSALFVDRKVEKESNKSKYFTYKFEI